MSVVVRVVVTGVPEAMQKLTEVQGKLQNDRETAVLQATNEVAGVWRQNFDREGGMVGGWAELAEKTQNLREYYGYSASHPILFRYGALRGVAVDFFQQARGSGSVSKSDSYSAQDTRGTLELSNGLAKLSAQGWKVANQYGFTGGRGESPTPPRPFWFVDNNVIAAAGKGVEYWLLHDVLR